VWLFLTPHMPGGGGGGPPVVASRACSRCVQKQLLIPSWLIIFSTCPMECVALDSSSSPPPAQSKDGLSAVSSSSSSVDSPIARYIGSAAATAGSGSRRIASDSSSASSRSSDSSDISSGRGGDFLSKLVSAEAATIQAQAPTSAAACQASAFPRKEQKSSYRTMRYFDEADASIT
jgi:hypothetical protein